MQTNNMLGKRITSYQYYFARVFARRMGYVNKVAFLVALVLSVVLAIPYGNFAWNLVASLYRVPLLYVALWMVSLCRQRNSSVQYSTAKTLAAQVVASVCTRKYYTTQMWFVVLSYIFNAVFLLQLPLALLYYVLAKEYRARPAVNDAWVYFWFHAYYAAVVYAAQSLIFQRNRLRFRYGVAHVAPERTLFAGFGGLLGNALGLTLVCSLLAPLVYYLARSLIYRLNWLLWAALMLDSSIPPFHIGLGNWLNVAYVLFFLFLAWEIANHTFDIYATIGCMDGKRTILSYSTDPVATLLSGLRDVEPKNQLARLTAFQELAHLATTTQPEGEKCRNAIYNAQSTSGHVWPAILDECALVIKDTTSRINYRSRADLDALQKAQFPLLDDNGATAAQDRAIFGNSADISANDTTNIAVSATSSPVKSYSVPKPAQSAFIAALDKLPLARGLVDLLKPLKSALRAYVTPQSGKPTSFQEQFNALRTKLTAYHKQFLSSGFGALFRITLKRDTESRVINPVNFGNAVIALSGLLMRAVEEDRSNTISNNNISEVLNLFERPIRACSNYTDMPPASVYLTSEQRAAELQFNDQLIALLHDLTMNDFFQLCVKYNYKLNDLLLSSRAFKLAKWVIDASIAQQQKMTKLNMTKFY